MPFGLLLDLWECHKQWNGQAKPKCCLLYTSESWQSTYGGTGNAHRIAVLEEGMKYTPIGISPEQAQFLDCLVYTSLTMRFPSKEIVEGIRRDYPAGTRVELVRMDDPQAPPVGTKGTVLGEMCIRDRCQNPMNSSLPSSVTEVRSRQRRSTKKPGTG